MKSQQKIWSHFQNVAPESFEAAAPRLDYLLRQIRKLAGSRKLEVLNVGAGNGYLEKRIRDWGWRPYSLDPDPQTVQRLASESILARVGYIERIPFDDAQFDVTIVSEVLEHLTSQQLRAGLREIRRVLKPGGFLLGTVPNRENLGDNKVICPKCGEIFHRWGHQQSFDAQALSALITPNFQIELLEPRPFVAWNRLNWKGIIGGLLKVSLACIGIHGGNEHLFVRATRPMAE